MLPRLMCQRRDDPTHAERSGDCCSSHDIASDTGASSGTLSTDGRTSVASSARSEGCGKYVLNIRPNVARICGTHTDHLDNGCSVMRPGAQEALRYPHKRLLGVRVQ